MTAKVGWRVDAEKDGSFAVTFFSSEGGDAMSMTGFATRGECIFFLALYMSLMLTGRGTDATALLQEFMSRTRH